MADFATVALSVAMVVGPIVGYIDQVKKKVDGVCSMVRHGV